MTEKVVKSVGRVFRILELFDRERRPMTAVEIARHLDYPHTSTLAILKSMETLGYLTHERETWAFFPARALTQVVEWVTGSLQDEEAALKVMEDLHKLTGETINLSRQTGSFIKIIYGLESTQAIAINVRPGTVMPLNGSHTGMVALATHTDEEVEQIIQELQLRIYTQARPMEVQEALKEVRSIRKLQFAPGYDLYIRGVGAVCFPVRPEGGGDRPLIIGVVGPTDRIRDKEKEILRAARASVKKHKLSLAYP